MSNLSSYEWVAKLHHHLRSTGVISNEGIETSPFVFLFESSANKVLDYYLKDLDSNDLFVSVGSHHLTIFVANDNLPGKHLRALGSFNFEIPTVHNLSNYQSQEIFENPQLLGFIGKSCFVESSEPYDYLLKSLLGLGISFAYSSPWRLTLIGGYEMLTAFNKLLPRNILDRIQLQIYTDFMQSSSEDIDSLLLK